MQQVTEEKFIFFTYTCIIHITDSKAQWHAVSVVSKKINALLAIVDFLDI